MSEEQVAPVISIMQQDDKFKTVRNWIYGYRIIRKAKSGRFKYHQGFNDGGEQGSGQRLLALLGDSLSLDNLLLIVTRWDSGPPGRMGSRLYHHINVFCKELLRELKKAVVQSFSYEDLVSSDQRRLGGDGAGGGQGEEGHGAGGEGGGQGGFSIGMEKEVEKQDVDMEEQDDSALAPQGSSEIVLSGSPQAPVVNVKRGGENEQGAPHHAHDQNRTKTAPAGGPAGLHPSILAAKAKLAGNNPSSSSASSATGDQGVVALENGEKDPPPDGGKTKRPCTSPPPAMKTTMEGMELIATQPTAFDASQLSRPGTSMSHTAGGTGGPAQQVQGRGGKSSLAQTIASMVEPPQPGAINHYAHQMGGHTTDGRALSSSSSSRAVTSNPYGSGYGGPGSGLGATRPGSATADFPDYMGHGDLMGYFPQGELDASGSPIIVEDDRVGGVVSGVATGQTSTQHGGVGASTTIGGTSHIIGGTEKSHMDLTEKSVGSLLPPNQSVQSLMLDRKRAGKKMKKK